MTTIRQKPTLSTLSQSQNEEPPQVSSLLKKKKKRSSFVPEQESASVEKQAQEWTEGADEISGECSCGPISVAAAHKEEDEEYSYEFLLHRCFGQAEVDKCEREVQNVCRKSFKPIKVVKQADYERQSSIVHPRESEHLKTNFNLRAPRFSKVFANFGYYCEKMKRPAKHFHYFLSSELRVICNPYDGYRALLIRTCRKDRLAVILKEIVNLFGRFFDDFVKCHQCRSHSTTYSRDKRTRFWLIKCDSCLAERWVRAPERPVMTTSQKGFVPTTSRPGSTKRKDRHTAC